MKFQLKFEATATIEGDNFDDAYIAWENNIIKAILYLDKGGEDSEACEVLSSLRQLRNGATIIEE